MANNVPVKCEGKVVGKLSGRGRLVGSVTLAGSLVFVRLDDEDRPDFWAEFALDLNELVRAAEADQAERQATRVVAGCSWCDLANEVGEAVRDGVAVYCRGCGHRADVCRMACDCEACRTPTRQELTAEDVAEAKRLLGLD